MRKIHKIFILVIVLFGAVIYIWISRPKGMVLNPEKLAEQIEKQPTLMFGLYPSLDEEGYDICCVENNKLVSCKERTLTCGERILFQVKISFDNSKYFVCANRDLFIDEQILSDEEHARYYQNNTKMFYCVKIPAKPKQIYYPWIGRLPREEKNFTLIEFYLIPLDLYQLSEDELLSRVGEFEKILEVNRLIKCKK